MQKKAFSPEEFLSDLFGVAVKAASPDFSKIKEKFPKEVEGKIIVIGAGKAAASMASSFELSAKELWSDSAYQKIQGLVITRYQHGSTCEKIKVVEASHPVPDEAGENAAHQIIQMLKDLTVNDLVVCLISGGGSSLLTVPAEGISLDEKKLINKQLLACGASISEINCVRKHLSKIKGGRLAEIAYPAKIMTYVISDVPGDDPSVIASGPTLPDETTCEDALKIIKKYRIAISELILNQLKSRKLETPKLNAHVFQNMQPPVVMGTAKQSIEAARMYAENAGFNALVLSDSIEGEAADVGKVLGATALWLSENKEKNLPKPLVLISGGETTVTVKNCSGRGGRNTEFLLSLVNTLQGAKNIYAIAADTDGIDGSENNAGAIAGPETLQKAKNKGLSAKDYLERNDAYTFFQGIDGLLLTGPTRTNVNDFRAIVILES